MPARSSFSLMRAREVTCMSGKASRRDRAGGANAHYRRSCVDEVQHGAPVLSPAKDANDDDDVSVDKIDGDVLSRGMDAHRRIELRTLAGEGGHRDDGLDHGDERVDVTVSLRG